MHANQLTTGKLFCLKRDFCDVVRFLKAISGRVLRLDLLSLFISVVERLFFCNTNLSLPSINDSFNYNTEINNQNLVIK